MTTEAGGIGAVLKAAREEKGWTVGDVSSRLRLMSRQIEAIEAEDFSKLGQPVFARGFVRNYAKLLGIDPDELLGQMTKIRAPVAPEKETVPFKPSEEFWKSFWFIGFVAALIILLAIPVSLYLWLNSDEEEPVAAAVEKTVPPPPPPPAPVLEAPSGVPATGMPVQADEAAVAGQATPAVPSAPAPTPQTTQPVAPKPAPPQATAPPAPTAVVRPPLPFPVPAPVAQPAAPVQAAPVPKPAEEAARSSPVRLQFDQSAWVQVRDSTGRTVHSGMNPAGTAVEVAGKAPYYLVIGNAAHVHLSYKGKPVDLTPYIDVTVARLTLNP